MGIPNIFTTGYTGLNAAKASISASSHNVANANTEGYSRQRVITETADPQSGITGKGMIGTGTRISRVERINDEYIERQIQNGQKDLARFEEKDLAMKQLEDVFNELTGDGFNRLVGRFFNDFRKLSIEPQSSAIRHAVRESAQSVVNDFRRIRKELDQVRVHLDTKIDGSVREMNSIAEEVADLNAKITSLIQKNVVPNDLLDKRDLALKKLSAFVDIHTNQDEKGNINVEMRGFGPLVVGHKSERLSVERTPADQNGKREGSFDVFCTSTNGGPITHALRGGKIGGMLEMRDQTVTDVVDRMDEIAFHLIDSVNAIHTQGINPNEGTGIPFFTPVDGPERASELIDLSDEIHSNVNFIATAAQPDSPGDNRIALQISQLQGQRIVSGGKDTFDEAYDSIVSDIGVIANGNRFALDQQKDIMTQLQKIREQVSGVSIDEETANLLQFQHAFEASAKVIQIADELFKTVLSLKRD